MYSMFFCAGGDNNAQKKTGMIPLTLEPDMMMTVRGQRKVMKNECVHGGEEKHNTQNGMWGELCLCFVCFVCHCVCVLSVFSVTVSVQHRQTQTHPK